MKKLALVLSFLSLAGTVSARADSIVFSNVTDTSFTSGFYTVGQSDGASWSVDNSFNLSETTTINEVMAGVWVPTGSTLVSAVGGFYTAPDGAVPPLYAATVGPISSTPMGTNDGYNLYAEYFDITPVTLGPGTYYLAFLSAITNNNGTPGYTVGWDIGGSPNNTADQWNNLGAQFSNLSPTTFALYGPGTSPVPEPSSLLLLGSGAAVLFGAIRRRVKA